MPRVAFEPKPDDFIVVVMGQTGAGKTNFINSLTGNAEQHNAGALKPHTEAVIPYPILYHGFRLVLVDTPGFDDTRREDGDVLRLIADWLKQKYPHGTTHKVAGTIYFHRITDNRLSGAAYKNLQTFGRLYSHVGLHRTCLVTTMWDQMKVHTLATQRESQLRDEHWSKLVEGGAIIRRFHNSSSARTIVDDLLRMRKDGDRLLLQEGQYERVHAQPRETSGRMKEMKTSLFGRILSWLFGRKSRAEEIELVGPRA